MRRVSVLVAFLLAAVRPADAQEPTRPVGSVEAELSAGPPPVSRNQIAVDIGIISLGVSYAHRVRETRFSVGGALWAAWEPAHTFDRNVWEPHGAVFFTRVSFPPAFQADAGLGVLRYVWTDDCSECTGTFVGLRVGARAGYGFIFLGPDIWLGTVSDERYDSDVGVLVDLQLKIVVGWGR